MIYTTCFLVLLVVTATLMALTLVSGHRALRRPHLRRALATVVALVATVACAYLMGEHELRLPAERMRVHRWFSMTVAGLVPLVALTGALLWRDSRWRRPHRYCVGLLVIATVAALATGAWVLLAAESRA